LGCLRHDTEYGQRVGTADSSTRGALVDTYFSYKPSKRP
jgi:hypothetical protein